MNIKPFSIILFALFSITYGMITLSKSIEAQHVASKPALTGDAENNIIETDKVKISTAQTDNTSQATLPLTGDAQADATKIAVPAPAAAAALLKSEPKPEPEPKAETEAEPEPIKPTLIAKINLTTQQMTVSSNGRELHSWRISSGRRGYETPPGTFKPNWLVRRWYSRQYRGAPMPYAVFFNRGIATHGTKSVGMLGRPASHGCIRLRTANARTFYNLVQSHGKSRTQILVTGRAKQRRKRPRKQYSYNSSHVIKHKHKHKKVTKKNSLFARQHFRNAFSRD